MTRISAPTLAALVALTMVPLAANSILNRLALMDGGIDAVTFGTVRLVSGAAMLSALCLIRDRRIGLGGPGRMTGILALSVYIFGFSLAYRALDAGVGALILFGMVQVTMFSGAIRSGETPPLLRWIGAGIALAGLAALFWPGERVAVPPLAGALMAAAGIGWGIYSLVGRGAGDPLQNTAANFLGASVIGLALLLWLAPEGMPSGRGLGLAILSGSVTSGLGYALWYRLLPQLSAAVAGVAQLSVPVIALAGGALLLGEVLTSGVLIASAVVLGGIALSLVPRR